jgi:catechol 2,3-dioxygenase-like lactoylglutathione lyase family enzyme
VDNRSHHDGSSVGQVRIARPTDRLAEVVRFYRDALGLEQIGSFEGHAGYEGVMLALPGRRDHLEFTHHESGSPCPAPTKDNLLVFYVEDEGVFRAMIARLRRHGHEPVEPENPYWLEKGLTFEDPDGWRVVLMHAAGI